MRRVRYLIVLHVGPLASRAARVPGGVNERRPRAAGSPIRNAGDALTRIASFERRLRSVASLRAERNGTLQRRTLDPSFCNYPVTHAQSARVWSCQFPLAWSRAPRFESRSAHSSITAA